MRLSLRNVQEGDTLLASFGRIGARPFPVKVTKVTKTRVDVVDEQGKELSYTRSHGRRWGASDNYHCGLAWVPEDGEIERARQQRHRDHVYDQTRHALEALQKGLKDCPVEVMQSRLQVLRDWIEKDAKPAPAPAEP